MPSSRGASTPVALVTGASRGLGLALARALADRGWALVVDARGREDLEAAAGELARSRAGAGELARSRAGAGELARPPGVVAVPGDVADPAHRHRLLAAVAELGRLDALVHNASVLGPSPQPALADYPLDVLEAVLRVNVVAPLALTQLALPWLQASRGRILAVTSDAAVEAYPGWGGYGSSKAALEQLTKVLAAEHLGLRIYQVDPGDLRTRLHQEAFPGEDISDRPLPEVAVPGLLRLIEGDLPSGRYRAQDLGRAARVEPRPEPA